MKSLWLAMLMVIVLISSCKKDKKENTLSIDQTELNISGLVNGSASLQITSNTNWTIKAAGNADWLQIEPSSGKGDATVQLKNKMNDVSGPAEVILTLSGDGVTPVTIKVTRTPLFYKPVLSVLGGSNPEQFTNGVATPDGGYILVGGTDSRDHDFIFRQNAESDQGDGIAVKYSATGAIEWKQFYGGREFDELYAVTITEDGGYLLVGSTESAYPDRKGGRDFWILKVDKNGVQQWNKLYGSKDNDGANACAAVNDGYIIAGNVSGKEGDITEDFGFTDAWIIKLDLNGNLKWQKSHGGSDHDGIKGLVRTSDGNFVLAGNYGSANGSGSEGAQGGQDAWLMKFDVNNGNKIWSKRYGGSQTDVLYNVYTAGNGDLIAVGTSSSNDGQVAAQHNGLEDGLVLKTAADGTLKKISLYGGPQNERIQAAIDDREQGLVVAGYTFSSSFGPRKGKADAIVLWMSKDGDIINSKLIGSTEDDTAMLLLKTTRNQYVTGGYFSAGDGDFSTYRDSGDCWSILFQ